MDQKMTGAKKVIKSKKSFFHARQVCEGVFEIASYWGLIFTIVCPNFEQLFLSFGKFFLKIFWLKSLLMQMVSAISDQMGSDIQQKWPDSNV